MGNHSKCLKCGELDEFCVCPKAQPAEGGPGPWKVLAEDDKPDATRLLDVVLRRGVFRGQQRYEQIDWTQVADWRYSTALQQPAAHVAVPDVNDIARAIFKVLRPSYFAETDWDNETILGKGNAERGKFITAAKEIRAMLAASPATVTEPAANAGVLDDLLTYPSPHGTLVRLADAKCRLAELERNLEGALRALGAENGATFMGEPVLPARAAPHIEAMVDRFLGWPLPKDFSPDCGISFDGRKDDEWNKNKTWPTGTNLLAATQARAMFEYCLRSAPATAGMVEYVEPDMLWLSDDNEVFANGPDEFANDYASENLRPGDEEDVDVDCATRASKRTMRITVIDGGDDRDKVEWKWIDRTALAAQQAQASAKEGGAVGDGGAA